MAANSRQSIAKGSTGSWVLIWQRFLNRSGYNAGTEDGIFGNRSEEATRNFQKDNKLPESGIVAKEEWENAEKIYDEIYNSERKILKDKDFEEAAGILNCETAAIKAVASVEAPRGGFFEDGRPVILFEAHKFSEFTGHKYDKSHPHISSPVWNVTLYRKGKAEYERLEEAKKLNEKAAIMATSWGKFQVMGFNHAAAGYEDVFSYVNAMHVSEKEHLLAFVNFIKSKQLALYLRNCNWSRFALGYNGKEYKKNNYDGKMAKAYQEFRQQEINRKLT